ncbi:MAG: 5'/3'-nucleotidase SurE [Phycisphaeraceae bacterium]|nr:5'/3'-nucleotidase SurE [Phycisphaeraceae bacterium]
MKVLLTNDDGLLAPGIHALYETLVDSKSEFGSMVGGGGRDDGGIVCPIAPLTVQSATSHGVTFKTPLMIDEERLGWGGDPAMTGITVEGRPADCTKLALTALWPERFGPGSRPDLVVSGMNMGANVGINVIYSGTVAAAIEAAFLGVPAIAVSLHMGRGTPRYDVAARYARRTIDVILAGGLPRPHECLSINIPVTEREWEVEGQWPPIRVCPMNTHGLNDAYERRVSPGGDVYYWAAGHGLDFRKTGEGTDVEWLWKNAITVTPLHYDLTRHDAIPAWKERLEGR